MKYHAHMDPRTLPGVIDPLLGYPRFGVLMNWYQCWRKVPYQAEIFAAILAEERAGEYRHYPCPLDPDHWHIGRGHGGRRRKDQLPQAKRVYRKAVRDEIIREHEMRRRVVREKEEALA